MQAEVRTKQVSKMEFHQHLRHEGRLRNTAACTFWDEHGRRTVWTLGNLPVGYSNGPLGAASEYELIVQTSN